MDLIYLFRRLVFAQVMLGVVAFCLAERNPGMLLVAGAMGTLSWYVAEGPTGRPLPQWLIHLGALVAVAWLMWEVKGYYGELHSDDLNFGMIVAMGHFTMWLQILQLYGRKSNREYALILVLGLLQMIGASVLSASMEYGVLLAAYCILAMFTVLLFQLKTISDQVVLVTKAAAPDPAQVTRGQPVVGRGHRWQFRLTALFIGAICAAVAAAVFIALPRTGDVLQTSLGRAAGGPKQTGFNPQVSLSSGPIGADNRDLILKLSITRDGVPVDHSPIGLLLRGAALDYYDVSRNTWHRSQFVGQHDLMLESREGVFELARAESSEPTFEANITLRQSPQGLLFAPFPPLQLQATNLGRISFNPYDQRLSLDSLSAASGVVQYRVRYPDAAPRRDLIPAYQDQLERLPKSTEKMPFSGAVSLAVSGDVRELGRGWHVQVERFRELALHVLDEAGLGGDPRQASAPRDEPRARALEHYLQTSSDYSYSLEVPAVAPGEDQVAAFLLRHKRGHCELFASALAGMARSLGMRARVVTGYRVSEFNSIGGYYVVRESNAHAWTEIYCEGKGWITCDATPPDTLAQEHQREQSFLHMLGDLYEHLEFTWFSSFVSYDERARAKLFSGINQQIHAAAHDEKGALGLVVAFGRQLRQSWQLDRFSYLFIVGISFFILVGIVSLARTLIKRHRRLVALQLASLPRSQRHGLAKRLRFYLIMLDILERHGHSRPRWQSPFDFAQHLARDDAHRFDPVVRLTEIFYEIRFGHRELDGGRKDRVRSNLRQLETALAGRREP